MAGNQKPLTVSEVTIDRMLSHYLWNKPIPPRKEDMVTAVTQIARASVRIDAVDYMKNGSGRYASAADFKMFENFFQATNLPAREKPYSFEEAVYLIYNAKDAERVKGLPNSRRGFTASVSQYGIRPSSADYVERAFIFGSTEVTVTKADIQQLQFAVHPDGSREIRNLRITPKNDNFDFEGGPSNTGAIEDRIKKKMVDSANAAFKATIDPKGIGKTVPIEYENTDNLKFVNITDKQFRDLQIAKSEREMSVKEGLPLLNSSGVLINKLMHSPSLYTNEYINDIKKYFNDAEEMYRKTREIIDRDPNMMSQNGYEGQYQYTQARSLTFADMPPLAQELCQKCQAKLEAYYQKHNIGYRQDDLERAALAAGVAAYGEKMTDLTMLNIKDGNIYVGHKTPQGVLNYASVNEQTAAATPEQDSIAQSKQAEIKLEEMERQREMEILAYQQSQSMGRSI